MVQLIDIPNPLAIELQCPKCKTKFRINQPITEFILCPKEDCYSAFRLRFSFICFANKPDIYEKKLLEGDKKFRVTYHKLDKDKKLRLKYSQIVKGIKRKGILLD